jgi:hypothetical protein
VDSNSIVKNYIYNDLYITIPIAFFKNKNGELIEPIIVDEKVEFTYFTLYDNEKLYEELRGLII